MNASSTTHSYKYLFGPVPSRRFGLSLGVDLVPHKICSLNCVFCEVGPTTCLTIERREYAPVSEIKRELKEWQSGGGTADFISVTGSGEPTLHTGFGEILEFIKKEIKIRSALLTNSSLLYLPEVRNSAVKADVVKATLSAWDENSFCAMMRPHPDLRFALLVEGLRKLRSEYRGQIWLEIFIVPGFNAELVQARKMAEIARALRPDKIQLNTAIRPTAESKVGAVATSFLREISVLFEPKAEAIAKYSGKIRAQESGQNAILAMLRRRPCTAADVATAFSMDIAEAKKKLRQMVAEKLVRIEKRAGEEYFKGM